LLRNPVYRGALSWGRRKGQGGSKPQDADRAVTIEDVFPALVSAETWEQAQAVRKSRTHLRTRAVTAEHPLTGILVCDLCGSLISGHTQNRYDKRTKEHRWTVRHYRCRKRVHNGGCSLPFLRADRIEAMVLERIAAFADPKLLARRLAQMAADQPDTSEEMKSVRARLRKARADMKRVDQDYRAGELGPRAYSRQIESLAAEEESLAAQLRDLEKRSTPPFEPRVQAAQYRRLVQLWPRMNMGERREAIRALVRQVRVLPGPEVQIVFRWEP